MLQKKTNISNSSNNKNNYQKNDSNSSIKAFKINDQIKSKEVRVIDHNGEMVGVLPLEKSIQMALDVGLDLVEVSPNANPPVCKITNFGKLRYEMQKKAADAKKKQKVVETKEIKMSINIGVADFDVKMKQTKRFIENGDKVKISVKMRGREITHIDLAKEMIKNILSQAAEFSKVEMEPKLEGSQIVVILVKK